MNFAHHSTFPVWLEMARTELLREMGVCYRDIEAMGYFLAVARLNIRYRSPARYDDVLTIHVKVLPTSGAKIEHEYEIHCQDRFIASAQTTLACIDSAGKMIRLPDVLMNDSEASR